MGKWFKNNLRTVTIVLAGLLILNLLYLQLSSIRFENAQFRNNSNGTVQSVTIPYVDNLADNLEFTITADFNYIPLLSRTLVNIVPDNTLLNLTINHNPVSLNGMPGLSDCDNGFNFDLKPYLQSGGNTIEMTLRNDSGPGGVKVRDSHNDPFAFASYVVFFFLLTGLAFILFRKLGFKTSVSLVLTAAFALRLIVLYSTPYTVRGHDFNGHQEYINYILDHFSLPSWKFGWQTYQPPLYYILCALIMKTGNILGVKSQVNLFNLLQWFSVVLNMGFVIAGYFIFERLFRFRKVILPKIARAAGFSQRADIQQSSRFTSFLVLISLAFLALWPSNLIHSVRIGNDVLFYLWFALGLLFLIRWQQEERSKDFYLSIVFAGLALITKGNALILFLLIGILALIRFIQSPRKKEWTRKILVSGAVFLTAFVITFHEPLMEKLKGNMENFLVPNVGGLRDVSVNNELGNYIYFDLKTFLTVPFARPSDDSGGRQYFWTYLAKTGLIAEFDYNNTPLYRNLAIMLDFIFVLMVLYSLGYFIFLNKRKFRDDFIAIVSLVILLFSELLFRVVTPYSCSNDMRYILPALVLIIYIFIKSIAEYRLRDYRKLTVAGYVLTGAFLTCAAVFIIDLLSLNR